MGDCPSSFKRRTTPVGATHLLLFFFKQLAYVISCRTVMLAKLYYGTENFYIRLKQNVFNLLSCAGGSMVKLSDLGFLKGIIAETIVSTYNDDKTPNAAPMGILMEDEHHLTIDLFNSTITQQKYCQQQVCGCKFNKQHRGFLQNNFQRCKSRWEASCGLV